MPVLIDFLKTEYPKLMNHDVPKISELILLKLVTVSCYFQLILSGLFNEAVSITVVSNCRMIRKGPNIVV
jgi:hypothetical protein